MSLLTELSLPEKDVLDPDYYVLLESHVPMLRTHKDTQLIEVNGQQAEKYTGDFHGLLDSLLISKKYHYLITRVNGYNCSTDYDGLRKSFYIPSMDVIGAFLATYGSIED